MTDAAELSTVEVTTVGEASAVVMVFASSIMVEAAITGSSQCRTLWHNKVL